MTIFDPARGRVIDGGGHGGGLLRLIGIAIAALVLKMVCAAAGFSLAALYLVRASSWSAARCQRAWSALFGFALTALTAAAFLRWFS